MLAKAWIGKNHVGCGRVDRVEKPSRVHGVGKTWAAGVKITGQNFFSKKFRNLVDRKMEQAHNSYIAIF